MSYVSPTVEEVTTYLGTGSSWTEDEVTAAVAGETAAQLQVIKLPTDPDPETDRPYPADLVEALCRRVAHNLALRGLPLGVQASITDGAVATNYVGGTDAEVRRLEAPYRRRTVG